MTTLTRPARLFAAAVLAGALALATVATPARAADPATRWADATLRRMSLEEKVGQLFVNYVYGASADAADSRNTERYGVATPAEVVAKYRLGGVIYFAWSDNVADQSKIAGLSNGLQRAARDASPRTDIPLTISTDQETGLVARIGPPATEFAGAMALGATRDPEATRTTYAITGRELRAFGINADYAPDADVNVNPANPVIGVRSFGSRPDLVAEHVPQAIAGLQNAKVSAAAKHFPGHGDTNVDSHTGFPVINHTREEWETIDAPPFRAAIEADADMIMTAHISVPALDPSGDPATLSEPIVTGILRDQLGYDGVVVTDSLRMDAVRQNYPDAEVAVRAIEAGVDVLLDANSPDVQYRAVIDAVRSGRLTEERIDQSVRRILAMKFERGAVAMWQTNPNLRDRVVGTARNLATAQEIADRSITQLTDAADLVPLGAGRTLVTGAGTAPVDSLTRALRDGGADAEAHATATNPDAAAITAAVERARTADRAVVITNNARANTGQAALVDALNSAGVPVVVVAVGVPYDIAYLDTESYLASYSRNDVALRSVARVLTGQVDPSGRLPVDIPSADDPDEIIYEFGSGE